MWCFITVLYIQWKQVKYLYTLFSLHKKIHKSSVILTLFKLECLVSLYFSISVFHIFSISIFQHISTSVFHSLQHFSISTSPCLCISSVSLIHISVFQHFIISVSQHLSISVHMYLSSISVFQHWSISVHMHLSSITISQYFSICGFQHLSITISVFQHLKYNILLPFDWHNNKLSVFFTVLLWYGVIIITRNHTAKGCDLTEWPR
jgi:hypothetical protein